MTPIGILVLLISLGLSLGAGRAIIDLWQRRDIVRVRQEELSALTRQNEELTRKLADIQSQSYVERVARDKLGLVKEGESLVIVPQATAGAELPAGDIANWKLWWQLFFK